MDAQDIIKIGRKAKNETEAFINSYLNDRAKGWPRLRLCTSACDGPRQQLVRKRGVY